MTCAPVRPAPASGKMLRRFVRGTETPRGVTWFGIGSFWGHLRHLAAAAIASDNIDSRNWMAPDDPGVLRARVLETLGGDPTAPSLVEGLGRDLYIDFVADTGDDVAVSRAVARLLFAPYELPDPDRPGQFLIAPRGDLLFFGGDTSYPVATAQEILNRVIVPWNQVLADLPRDARRRVLIGIPGNHDWYDGLDGFARMFRRPENADRPLAPLVGVRSSKLLHHAEWAVQFVRGGVVRKPDALALEGYTPVQSSSYFALRLTSQIDLLAADRQLTAIDPRQRTFLKRAYRQDPDSAALVVLPDPVHQFGDPSKTGTQMVESLGLRATARQTFVLTGDLHHYERLQKGEALHVIAGGGGAFLHPARVAKGGLEPTSSWPGARQSRLLLRDVPWKLALGRSGLLPHLSLLLLYAPQLLFDGRLLGRFAGGVAAPIGTLIAVGIPFALLGGVTRRKAVLPLALGAAAIVALIPGAASLLLRAVQPSNLGATSSLIASLLALLAATFCATFVFGALLTLFTLFGYEHMQALTALDHPGFKHFVRLRVRADGTGIDAWCVGVADPLAAGAQPELVDVFTWRPFAGGPSPHGHI